MHILTLHCPVMFIRDIMQWRLRHVWDTEIKRLLQNFLPGFASSKILFVGLRNWERKEIIVRQNNMEFLILLQKDVAQNSDAVKCWLKTCDASKVLIHFVMDVLDPSEIVAAVGTDPRE